MGELFLGNADAFLWLALMVLFIVLEALTTSLFSIWFSVGSLCSMLFAACGSSFGLQIFVFFIVSGALLLITKPLTNKFINQKTVKTNADRLLGATGVVTEEISNLNAKGRVFVSGQSWSARAQNEELIPEGTLVTILRIDGVKLIVEPKMNADSV